MSSHLALKLFSFCRVVFKFLALHLCVNQHNYIFKQQTENNLCVYEREKLGRKQRYRHKKKRKENMEINKNSRRMGLCERNRKESI